MTRHVCMMMWHCVWWCDTDSNAPGSHQWPGMYVCMMMWHCVWWCDGVWWCDAVFDHVRRCMMMWHSVWWCLSTCQAPTLARVDDVTLCMMWHCVWWCDTIHDHVTQCKMTGADVRALARAWRLSVTWSYTVSHHQTQCHIIIHMTGADVRALARVWRRTWSPRCFWTQAIWNVILKRHLKRYLKPQRPSIFTLETHCREYFWELGGRWSYTVSHHQT
jgi:hypothetical protein